MGIIEHRRGEKVEKKGNCFHVKKEEEGHVNYPLVSHGGARGGGEQA